MAMNKFSRPKRKSRAIQRESRAIQARPTVMQGEGADVLRQWGISSPVAMVQGEPIFTLKQVAEVKLQANREGLDKGIALAEEIRTVEKALEGLVRITVRIQSHAEFTVMPFTREECRAVMKWDALNEVLSSQFEKLVTLTEAARGDAVGVIEGYETVKGVIDASKEAIRMFVNNEDDGEKLRSVAAEYGTSDGIQLMYERLEAMK